MDKPFVVVIMPAYNAEKFIRKSILGVLDQTFKDFALYIINDCSTDKTEEIVKSFKDPRIFLYKTEKNSGVSAARNVGLQSSGVVQPTHIAFCDSDDVWDPYHLQLLVDAATKLKAAMVYAKPRLQFENGEPAVAFGIPDFDHFPGIGKLKEGNFIYISGVMIDFGVYLETGGFDSELDGIEDWDYWIRVAKSYEISCLCDKTFTYLIKQNGMGSIGGSKHDKIRKKYQDKLNSNPKVSIVIPTHKHLSELRRCLDSVLKYTNLENLEIVIVANGCGKDGTMAYLMQLSELFPETFVFVNYPHALGYTKATNEGIRLATGDYIILLNNDTELLGQNRGDWVRMLINPMLQDRMVGVTGPAVVHSPYANHPFAIFFCACISRAAIDAVGLLDEVFSPGGGEDIDFCVMAAKNNFKIVQVPVQELTSGDGMLLGGFPIYHQGEATMHDEEHREKWGEIFQRRPGEARDDTKIDCRQCRA